VVGSGRTAEELGRAFPGITVRSSGGGAPVLAEVAAKPELVVATPGAEPRASGGYGAALLLDGWAMLSRPDLRVAEETLRRWLAAAALVVPHTEGGRVVVMADTAIPVVQSLVRWDPAGHAAAELASRAEVGFPPAVRMATVEGTAAAVADMLAELPSVVEVLGPVELEPVATGAGDEPPEVRERALLRVPRTEGRAMAAALHAAQAARTARKVPDPVRVRLDPVEIG
jgi:primosomal protein N' (replication factor Y)